MQISFLGAKQHIVEEPTHYTHGWTGVLLSVEG